MRPVLVSNLHGLIFSTIHIFFIAIKSLSDTFSTMRERDRKRERERKIDIFWSIIVTRLSMRNFFDELHGDVFYNL